MVIIYNPSEHYRHTPHLLCQPTATTAVVVVVHTRAVIMVVGGLQHLLHSQGKKKQKKHAE